MNVSKEDGEINAEGPFNEQDLQLLLRMGHIENLFIRSKDLLTVKLAKILSCLHSVKYLDLRCRVTSAAMQYIVKIPNLEILYITQIKCRGRISGLSEATRLKEFYCFGLGEEELLEIISAPLLRKISAQSSTVTSRVVNALLKMPYLESLDVEGTDFDDTMAAAISTSKTLRNLELGATQLGLDGLKYISKMEQLQSLDIWATKVYEEDLDLLAVMPCLEYLSVGGVEDQTTFTAKNVIPKLRAIPALQRIWLDGIKLTAKQRHELDQIYELIGN